MDLYIILIMKHLILTISFFLAALALLFCAASLRTPPAAVLRLHVVADGDDARAQAVKLRVRDAILSIEGERLAAAVSSADARRVVREDAAVIQRAADEVLKKAGVPYRARLSIGTYPFPLRTYGEKSYPAGDYTALRVVLGSGKGKNWWCVLYPPLCIVAPADGEIEYEENGEIKWKSLLKEWMDKGENDHEQAQ